LGAAVRTVDDNIQNHGGIGATGEILIHTRGDY
jgi:hypothetical protein